MINSIFMTHKRMMYFFVLFISWQVAWAVPSQTMNKKMLPSQASVSMTSKPMKLNKNLGIKGINVLNNNTLSLKQGYRVRMLTNHSFTVVSERKKATGTFDCSCNLSSGGCDVVVTPTSVSCATSSCSNSCFMIVTIPTKAKRLLRR